MLLVAVPAVGASQERPRWQLLPGIPDDAPKISISVPMQGFKDLAGRPGMTPDTLLAQLMTMVKGECGDRAFAQRLPVTSVDSFQATAAIIGCSEFSADHASGAKKGQSEPPTTSPSRARTTCT